MENRIIKVSLFLVLVVFLVGVVSAGSVAHIKTIPEETTWIADGHTWYRMNVYADNTELIGEYTQGIQWDVLVPNQYINVVDAQIPGVNDFFEGSNMAFEFITTDLTSQARVTWLGEEKTNQTGFVGGYWFTVSPGFVGTTSFDLGRIIFADEKINEQPYDISNVQFEVVNPKAGKLKHNGNGLLKNVLNVFSWRG